MKTKLLWLMASFLFSMNSYAVTLEYSNMPSYQNRRDHQEDRSIHTSIRDRNRKKMGDFIAVYDGHGGDKASSLLQKKLHHYFNDCLIRRKKVKDAFESAFAKVEEEALKSFDDGSTAVVGYVDSKNILHAAWVGDSRLVVECNGKVAFATEDHKPDRPDERDRIENQSLGKVYMDGVWRVLGLAVSRSIGDRMHKMADQARKNGGIPGRVIASPEYMQYQLTSANSFAIVASDGLWDAVTNDQAVAIAKNALQANQSCNDAAHALKNEAIKRGSGDNITITVAKFDWNKK
jgi:protein phosphatase 1L